MITREMLTGDTALGTLTDEQINAIVTLSRNDEEAVIGARFREVYNQLDETIARTTGIARNGDEKTYLYMERAALALAAKANSVEGLQTKVNELTRERDRLKKAVEEGAADESLKKQLSQAQADLNNVRQLYDTLKEENDKMREEHATEIMNLRVDNEIRQSLSGIKFKAEFPASVTDVIVNNAIAKIKGMNPEFKDDGTLIFRDDKGATLQNTENHLNPYTAAELLMRELKQMGVVDEGRQQPGGGTKPLDGGAGGSGSLVFDVSMARTQSEAQEMIHTQLMQQGYVNGTEEYEKAMMQAWKDNQTIVANLPVQ